MTGRQLGRKCGRLAEKNHGAWFARFEAPPGADGKRRQFRVGPYGTEREAKAAVVAALARWTPACTWTTGRPRWASTLTAGWNGRPPESTR